MTDHTPKQSQIYKQGYEKWTGDRGRALPSFYLIGRAGLRNILKTSGCIGRLVQIFLFFFPLASFYFVILASTISRLQIENLKHWSFFEFFANMIDQSGIQLTEGEIHVYFLSVPSLIFSMAVMIFYGSQLIAKDKGANALQVYFSKAIDRGDYILGKYFTIGVLTSVVTLIPSLLMLVLGLLLTTDHLAFFKQAWYLPLSAVAFWLIFTYVVGTVTLSLSSFFTRPALAGVSIIGFAVFFFAVTGLVIAFFGTSYFLDGFFWVVTLVDYCNILYTGNVENWPKLFWQTFDLLLICGTLHFLMLRNIKPVEVVK